MLALLARLKKQNPATVYDVKEAQFVEKQRRGWHKFPLDPLTRRLRQAGALKARPTTC